MEEVSAEDPTAELGQPPPFAPMPPPNLAAIRSRRMMVLILCLGLASILALGVFAWRREIRGRQIVARTEAIANMKSLCWALEEFQDDYGRCPDATTAAKVKADTGTPLTLGTSSSNQIFRQLIVTRIKSERPFYARTAFTHRPDDNFADDAHMLAPGECGFAYVPDGANSSDPDAPVLMTPTVRGGPLFDPSICGDALILKSDSTIVALPIDKSGHAIWKGMDLLDPRQTFWHGKAPDVKWPE